MTSMLVLFQNQSWQAREKELIYKTLKKFPKLVIYGNDYDTNDGTGERDYIHVVDLAKAHVASLKINKFGSEVFNIGTGKGHSVLEIVQAFESITGIKISHKIASRRDGDIAESWADTSKAFKDLGWEAEFDLNQMIQDAWNWQKSL